MSKRKNMDRHLVGLMAVATIAGAAHAPAPTPAAPAAPINPALWPAPVSPFKPDVQLEKRVTDLLAKMTLEEKVGQVIQPDINSVTPEDMRRYHFGSILSGGNSSPDKDEFAPAANWLALADAFYNASVDRSNDGQGIPSIWAIPGQRKRCRAALPRVV